MSEIMNRITWFGCFELFFEMYACVISFFLYGMSKTLRAINL